MNENVFQKYTQAAWPITFQGSLHFIDQVRGGTPSDPNKAEGWLKTKLSTTDQQIQALVAQTMVERGITAEQAVVEVNKLKHLNGFKRDELGLYIEGRQLKAALKEACVVALSANKIVNKGWGATKKSLRPFLAEHVIVDELRLHLRDDDGKVITEPTGVDQRFVHTFQGNGISYEEFVTECNVDFTIKTDWPFTRHNWAMILLTGGEQGLGATRSQGHGRYIVTKFDQVSGDPIKEK